MSKTSSTEIPSKQVKTYALYQHQLPVYFKVFPFLITPVHVFHRILHNRNRILLRTLKKTISDMGGNVRLLDAGCGEGNYCIPLAHKFHNASFFAVDYNTQLVEFLNVYSKYSKINLSASVTDLNQPNLDGSYDIVLCVAVLQMLKSDVLLLENFHQILNPKGRLVINIPIDHQKVLNLKAQKEAGYTKIHGGINRKYSLQSITKILEESGFKAEVQIITNGRFGTAGNELLNWIIDAIQNSAWIMKLLYAIVFTFPVLPVIILLNILNGIFPKKNPSGTIIIAEKK